MYEDQIISTIHFLLPLHFLLRLLFYQFRENQSNYMLLAVNCGGPAEAAAIINLLWLSNEMLQTIL